MITKHAHLKPVGQRPRCLHCHAELQPRFIEMTPGYGIPGPMLWGSALKEWKKQNPGWKIFTGFYGRYKDNRFCGLNCGYDWAVAHSLEAK